MKLNLSNKEIETIFEEKELFLGIVPTRYTQTPFFEFYSWNKINEEDKQVAKELLEAYSKIDLKDEEALSDFQDLFENKATSIMHYLNSKEYENRIKNEPIDYSSILNDVIENNFYLLEDSNTDYPFKTLAKDFQEVAKFTSEEFDYFPFNWARFDDKEWINNKTFAKKWDSEDDQKYVGTILKEYEKKLGKKELKNPEDGINLIIEELFGNNKAEIIQAEIYDRLYRKEIKKWIEDLGSSECDYQGNCKSKWINLAEIKERMNDEFEELDKLGKEVDIDSWRLKKEKDFTKEEKEKADYYETRLNEIIDHYESNVNCVPGWVDFDSNFKEQIENNEWVKLDNKYLGSPSEQFENAEWALNDEDCLAQILLANEKLATNSKTRAYDSFEHFEPKSNFNLVSHLVEEYGHKYPDFFKYNYPTSKYGYENFIDDIKSGKIANQETYYLGFYHQGGSKENEEEKAKIEQVASLKVKLKK